VAVPVADPTQRHRSTPTTAGDVLAALVPDLPAAKASRAERAASSSARAAAELRRLAADPQTVQRLLRMPAPRAIVQVLAAAGVYDTAPKRREGLAVQVGRALDMAQVLALACDVLLGRPASIGATLRARLRRAVEGKPDLLTRCRAAWPIGRFLEAVAHDAQEPAPAPLPEPSKVPPTAVGASPAPQPRGAAPSFDELLSSMGLADLVRRRATA
jgi:hypothetical protein